MILVTASVALTLANWGTTFASTTLLCLIP